MTGQPAPAPAPELDTDAAIARRTAATWLAATGAFLLLAATILFVAVRWQHAGAGAKLAVAAVLTGVLLAAGGLRRSLPATSRVLVHLGALLVPVDVAALAIRLGAGWPEVVLVAGATGAVTFAVAATALRSRLLADACTVAVVVAAGGVAATTGAPLAVLLAGAGLLAVVGDPSSRSGLVWSSLGGLTPVVGSALAVVAADDGVLGDLGLLGAGGATCAVAAAVAGGLALGLAAQRTGDVVRAHLAVAALAVGAATAVVDATWASGALRLASMLFLVEAVALAATADPFWCRPTARLAAAARGIGVPFAIVTVVAALATAGGDVDRALGAVALITALTWTAATLRSWSDGPGRRGARTTGVVATAALAAVVLAWSGSATVAALGLLALAAGVAALRTTPVGPSVGSTGDVVAAAIAVAGALVARLDGVGTIGATSSAAVAAVLLALVAVERDRIAGADDADDEEVDELTIGLGLAAVAAAALASGLVEAGPGGRALAGAGFVAACWVLAAVLDHGRGRLGDVARSGALLLVVVAPLWSARDAAVPVALLAAAAALDAARRRDVPLAHAAALLSGGAVATIGAAAGLPLAGVGLCLCAAGVVHAALAAVTPGRWEAPFVTGSVSSLVVGLLLAADGAAWFGPSLILAGGVVVGAGIAGRRPVLVPCGAAAAVVGTWIVLVTGGVVAVEAYALPLVALLVGTGVLARSAWPGSVSSWVAYGPAVGLATGAPLLERWAGGPGWHALGAGIAGVVAVVVGGHRQLAAPLFIGTAALVAMTGYESIGVAAGVPTWAWLALAGAALVGGGVALERSDTSPSEVGRRLVDVVAERFA